MFQVSGRIREDLMKRASEFNIFLEDVSITHLTFGQEFTHAVEQKQVAQQEAERARYVVEKVTGLLLIPHQLFSGRTRKASCCHPCWGWSSCGRTHLKVVAKIRNRNDWTEEDWSQPRNRHFSGSSTQRHLPSLRRQQHAVEFGSRLTPHPIDRFENVLDYVNTGAMSIMRWFPIYLCWVFYFYCLNAHAVSLLKKK